MDIFNSLCKDISWTSWTVGGVFWGGTAICLHSYALSHLLLVISGGKVVTLIYLFVLCLCCVSSQTGILSLCFENRLILCLGRWSTWLMEKAGGTANTFHFLDNPVLAFFSFSAINCLKNFGKKLLKSFYS